MVAVLVVVTVVEVLVGACDACGAGGRGGPGGCAGSWLLVVLVVYSRCAWGCCGHGGHGVTLHTCTYMDLSSNRFHTLCCVHPFSLYISGVSLYRFQTFSSFVHLHNHLAVSTMDVSFRNTYTDR